MKAPFASLLMLVIAAAMLPAQAHNQQAGSVFGFQSLPPSSPAQTSTRTLAFIQPPIDFGCPVSLRAQHLSDGDILRAGDAQHPAGIGQRLHLTLIDSKAREISNATLAINGYSPRSRMVQTSLAESGKPDFTRTVTVSFSADTDSRVSADLWVPGMSAVQEIDIKSVTYTNGSTWKLAGNPACRVVPDGSMPVAAR